MSTHEIKSDLGFGKKSVKSYIIGFALSFLLTTVAFECVAQQVFSITQTYLVVTLLAIMQLLVQALYFIRLTTEPTGRWNSFPFLFSLLIISILVGGSLWIMYNLNINMTH